MYNLGHIHRLSNENVKLHSMCVKVNIEYTTLKLNFKINWVIKLVVYHGYVVFLLLTAVEIISDNRRGGGA